MSVDHRGHDHEHHRDQAQGHANDPHPTREDDDVALSEGEAKFLALKSLLIEK